jgi:hypothetical protein
MCEIEPAITLLSQTFEQQRAWSVICGQQSRGLIDKDGGWFGIVRTCFYMAED